MTLVALLARQGGEVQLGQRLLDEALLVVGVERLAGDLLGRGDREVGHLATDLLDRAAGLRLDLAARLLHHLLALGARPGDDLRLRGLAGAAGAGDDLVSLFAGLRPPPPGLPPP